MVVQDKDSAAAGTQAAATRRRPAIRVTLALMSTLLVLGGLGAGSFLLLTYAQRPTTQDDLAQRVCTAYQTRNYDLLVANVDPTPIKPAAPGAFTAAAQKAITTNLQALDAQSGAVTQCHFSTLGVLAAGHQHVGFDLTRAHSAKTSLVMDFVHQPDGQWKIARDSQFTPASV
ncbi:MAG: hypothetical protein ACHQ4H_10215 [Ktedonobacterales bacterium]